jgi:ATP-dependent helicase YprA (DUF1998 family)
MGSRHFVQDLSPAWQQAALEQYIEREKAADEYARTSVNKRGMQLLREWLEPRLLVENDGPITQSMLNAWADEIEQNMRDGYEPQCELRAHQNDWGVTEIFYMPPEGMGE